MKTQGSLPGRPLNLVLYWLHIMFSASCCLDQFQTELNPQGQDTFHKQIQSQRAIGYIGTSFYKDTNIEQ